MAKMNNMQEEKYIDVGKIIDSLVEYKKLKEIQDLAVFLEMPRQSLYSWIKRGRIAKPRKILVKIPELNISWLQTGEGPMLNNATDEPAAPLARSAHTDKEFDDMVWKIELLEKRVKDKEEIIDGLRRENETLRAGLAEPVKKKQQL
ncbi:MAG: helix-turn-helix domain-containing protein [Desulfobulbaceae bacterium]|nr:helix-turn-helix domain-containing protein [Desulfobulbaceae bacterium]